MKTIVEWTGVFMARSENEIKMMEYLKTDYDENTISCPDAQALARKWHMNMLDMAGILTELGIKIRHCMLGCF